MKVIKQVHPGYTELVNAKIKNPKFDVPPIFEKWRYVYAEGDVEISLVQFTPRMYAQPWEIYQLRGDQLFEDVERFMTRKDAEARIKSLMENNLGVKKESA